MNKFGPIGKSILRRSMKSAVLRELFPSEPSAVSPAIRAPSQAFAPGSGTAIGAVSFVSPMFPD
jgi:hypothetical protein